MNVALRPTPSYQQHNWSQGCLMPVLARLLRPGKADYFQQLSWDVWTSLRICLPYHTIFVFPQVLRTTCMGETGCDSVTGNKKS